MERLTRLTSPKKLFIGLSYFILLGCDIKPMDGDVKMDPNAIDFSKVSIESQSLIIDENSAGDWMDSQWAYRRTIELDNSTQPSTLTDIPIMVELNSGRIDYSKTKANGADIRFTSESGSLLDYEIENWDTNGRSIVWVKIPSLAGSSKTNIYMYYGNANANTAENSGEVWSNGYMAVWHMSEDPTGSAPQLKDSTNYANHGTAQGTFSASDLVDGKFGKAINLAGVDQYFEIPQSSSLDIQTAEFTLSTWAKVGTGIPADSNGDLAFICKGTTNSEQYMLAIDNGATYDIRLTTTNDDYVRFDQGTVVIDSWNYIVGRYDGANIHILRDLNVEVSDVASGTVVPHLEYLVLGKRCFTDTRYMKAVMDEVRISNVSRSSDWMALQSLSMNGQLISSWSSEAEMIQSSLVEIKLKDITAATDATIALTYTGTATRDEDYTAPNSVVIKKGESSAKVPITTIADNKIEGTETLKIAIIILDHEELLEIGSVELQLVDSTVPVISFSEGYNLANEADGTHQLTVNIDPVRNESTVVPITISGTATSPGEYTVASGTVTLPAGDASANYTVTLVDDGATEPDTNLLFSLGDVDGTQKGNYSFKWLDIVDDD